MAMTPKQVSAPAAGATQKNEPGPLQKMANRILSMKNELAMIMPKEMNVNRIVRIMMNCVQDTPKLLECSESSFLGCLFKAAQYGLEPNTGDGYAYLIPYKGVCTFQIGYQGILKLARNTGQYARIDAIAVYKGDHFTYDEGFFKNLEHRAKLHPETGSPIREGDPHTYYALYIMKDGTKDFKVWPREECLAHGRKFSKAFNNGPWQDHTDRMCKKTVLIDLFKYADKSVEVMRPIADVARLDMGSAQLKQAEPGKPIEIATNFDHLTLDASPTETAKALTAAEIEQKDKVKKQLLKTANERFQARLDGGMDMVSVQELIKMSQEQMQTLESEQLMVVIELLGKQ